MFGCPSFSRVVVVGGRGTWGYQELEGHSISASSGTDAQISRPIPHSLSSQNSLCTHTREPLHQNLLGEGPGMCISKLPGDADAADGGTTLYNR